MNAADHLGQLALQRLFAGELPPGDADRARAHTTACEACRAKLHAIESAQQRFEAELPFDAFARGVERAARIQQSASRAQPKHRRWIGPALALAASVIAVVAAGPVLRGAAHGDERPNHLKGGAGMELVIQGAHQGPQRTAGTDVAALLATGERVRIGYQSGAEHYVSALSIDDHGEVTPLYPDRGMSAQVEAADSATHYVPDAWEFTGKGMERVIVVLSGEPLSQDVLANAARDAYARSGGDLGRMSNLAVQGEQFHRLVLKP